MHLLAYLSMQKWYGMPPLPKILGQNDLAPCKNSNLHSVFAHSTSAVMPREKSYNIINTESTKIFLMSVR